MNPRQDVIIVGAGLAGASAALWLAPHYRVLLIDAEEPASGASGAGAGLINPLLGRRARPAWRIVDALAAVEETIELAGAEYLYDDRGIIRPAADAVQADRFSMVATAHPELAAWFSPDRLREEFPDIETAFGGLRVLRGGAIDISGFVRAMISAAMESGARLRTHTRLTRWNVRNDGVEVHIQHHDEADVLPCDRLILAVGDGFSQFEALRRLDLHRVKGQTIRVRRPAGIGMPCALPPVSGSGYIVPEIATWILGSTYEHDFSTSEPTIEADGAIIDKTSEMMPCLREAEVIERRAGVRVSVPRRRLPIVGPVDGDRVWTIVGLGSKGLLLGPMIAKNLRRWLEAPSTVPPELRHLLRE